MRQSSIPHEAFQSIFNSMIQPGTIRQVVSDAGPARRRPPTLAVDHLISSLVFHQIAGPGKFSHHVKRLTGQTITDGALSQRRARLPSAIFEQLLAEALEPLAEADKHPEAFYQGMRLVGIDGTRFSTANTPSIKRTTRKAKSRRGRAAFPQLNAAVMVELGLHNPVGAIMGTPDDSEMSLARQLWTHVPKDGLLIADRYYGAGEVLAAIQVEEGQGYLVRVRSNLKPKHLQQLPDGSALVEVRSTHGPVVVRELRGQVRRGKGKATDVRLWTSLVDHSRFAARDLIALYGRRWEQEGFYRELKVDTRSHQLLDSQTELTALQEIAALILGYAVLVRYRLQAASRGKVGVLRISFMKTLFILQGLWQFLELASDMLSPSDVRKLIRRAMTEMGELPIEKRRPRSCPRAIRRPVSGWRRLRRNTYVDGDINIAIKDSNPKNI